jgi:hypothetical protein
MDIQKILTDLRRQRDSVDSVIEALQTIAGQETPRRGRPPKWLTVNRIRASKSRTNGAVNGELHLPAPLAATSGD